MAYTLLNWARILELEPRQGRRVAKGHDPEELTRGFKNRGSWFLFAVPLTLARRTLRAMSVLEVRLRCRPVRKIVVEVVLQSAFPAQNFLLENLLKAFLLSRLWKLQNLGFM